MNLAMFSGRDIGNAIALLEIMEQGMVPSIPAAIVMLKNYTPPVPRRATIIKCSVCGGKTDPLGCKARRCPACDHQYKPNWQRLKRFGR